MVRVDWVFMSFTPYLVSAVFGGDLAFWYRRSEKNPPFVSVFVCMLQINIFHYMFLVTIEFKTRKKNCNSLTFSLLFLLPSHDILSTPFNSCITCTFFKNKILVLYFLLKLLPYGSTDMPFKDMMPLTVLKGAFVRSPMGEKINKCIGSVPFTDYNYCKPKLGKAGDLKSLSSSLIVGGCSQPYPLRSN